MMDRGMIQARSQLETLVRRLIAGTEASHQLKVRPGTRLQTLISAGALLLQLFDVVESSGDSGGGMVERLTRRLQEVEERVRVLEQQLAAARPGTIESGSESMDA